MKTDQTGEEQRRSSRRIRSERTIVDRRRGSVNGSTGESAARSRQNTEGGQGANDPEADGRTPEIPGESARDRTQPIAGWFERENVLLSCSSMILIGWS
jgi:hypothetical protein